MVERLHQIVAKNRAGAPVAIPSVCSGHREVLVSSLKYAAEIEQPIVIEATSNQVNQDGGYTGMTPSDFVAFTGGLISEVGIDPDLVVLGGDHLGPQVWRRAPADQAMEKARDLVKAYVRAGIRKIHLDCSEGCAGEPAQLDDVTAAARSASLAKACRDAVADPSDIVFVIGTEVPPPGGARMDETGHVIATTPESAKTTVQAHKDAFDDAGVSDMWAHVTGLVVQPGVEFTPDQIHHFPVQRDPGFREAVAEFDGICLEAHSTDYQHPFIYPRLAELGFAFQKVGPALTYAWRQALYRLDELRSFVEPGSNRLFHVIEAAMESEPAHWENHYPKSDRRMWHFGYADRVRYYWPNKNIDTAIRDLLATSDRLDHPDYVLGEVFSPAVIDRSKKLGASRSLGLAHANVQQALAPYFFGENNE